MTLQLDGVSLVRLMGSSRPAFVLASTTGCTQCDGPLGGAWEQLATLTRDQLREPGAVWRLSCDEQPMLCDVLPAVAAATPGDPLFMEWSQGDMMWRRYSGELNTQGLVLWVRDTLSNYNRLPAEKRQPQQRSPSGLVTVGFDGVVSSMPPPTPPPWPLSPPSPLGQSRLPLGIEHTPHEYVPHDDDVGAPLSAALAALAANRTFAAEVWARQPLLLQLPRPVDFSLNDLEAALTLPPPLPLPLSPYPYPDPNPNQAALAAGVFASAADDDTKVEADANSLVERRGGGGGGERVRPLRRLGSLAALRKELSAVPPRPTPTPTPTPNPNPNPNPTPNPPCRVGRAGSTSHRTTAPLAASH